MSANPPNMQSDAAAYLPMRLSDGTSFYVAGAGGGGGGGGPSGETPLGYQQITTALSSAQALTVPAGATSATVQAEAVDVRWRDDGISPVAGIGMLLPAGTTISFAGAAELAAVKFIQSAAGSILNVSYYK